MLRIHCWTTPWFVAIGYAAVLQVFAVLIGSLFAYAMLGPNDALAACYGGATALANTLFIVWRMRQPQRTGDLNAFRQLRSLYRSSMERFIVVGALLAVGMGVLHLAGLPLIAGFVFGQVSLMISQFLRAI